MILILKISFGSGSGEIRLCVAEAQKEIIERLRVIRQGKSRFLETMRSAGESSQQRKSTNEEKNLTDDDISGLFSLENVKTWLLPNKVILSKTEKKTRQIVTKVLHRFLVGRTHKIMEHLLEESVSASDLKRFETRYVEELQSGTSVVSSGAQFEYAWCLVRSKYPADIRKGILLLEDLYKVRSISMNLQKIY